MGCVPQLRHDHSTGISDVIDELAPYLALKEAPGCQVACYFRVFKFTRMRCSLILGGTCAACVLIFVKATRLPRCVVV